MPSPASPAALLALVPLLAQEDPLQAPYETLTNNHRSVANLNVETVRGLAYDALQDRLYAINTHGSTLMAFDATPPAGLTLPLVEWRTLNNPVAMALWDDGSGGKFAIVVGGGTHGVVKQDRQNGSIVDYLKLPSEPTDVVLDTQRNLAFVSCAGAFDDPSTPSQPTSGGVVMQIDLASFAFSGGTPSGSGQHWIDAMRPSFLNIEMGPQANDNFIFVTPFLSANRTTFNEDAWGDSTVVTASALPDDDLYRISEAGVVSAVFSGAGTLLTAHGRNPSTQDYWIANVEAFNAAQHTEPSHRGRFAANRVTRIVAPPSGAFSLAGFSSLDGNAPSAIPAAANKPASFPFGLVFDAQGNAFVSASTGDVLRVLDSGGATLRSVGLPQGSIPRSLLLPAGGSTLFVYLWGTNRVLAFDAAALVASSTTSISPLSEFDLGADPLPEAAKDGRATWYDADNSNDPFASVPGKVSCNTCHPRGGLDALGWDLGGPPLDRKDTMVTQSLLSIEDSFPYHWRGERSLSDFNGAFHDLLGGTVLDDDDLADFEAFVFSLQAPANPRQNLDRLVDDGKPVVHFSGITGSAVTGQQIFHTTPDVLGGFKPATCVDCHGAESGSNGLITSDAISGITTQTHLETAHLRQLHHKLFQPETDIGGGDMRPRSGFGFSQDGNDNDIVEFLNPAVFFVLQGSQQDTFRTNAASFVVQFDQGIAPRAHHAFLLACDDYSAGELGTMIDQAEAGWIGVAVIGHTLSGGVPAQALGLWYDPDTDLFHTAEVGVGLSISGSDLLTLCGSARFLVLGLPPGNGFRFAVDPDDDEMSNTAEILFNAAHSASLSLRKRDTDGDSFPDGYEADHYPGIDPGAANTLAQVQAADTVLPDLDPQRPDVLDFVTGRASKHFVAFTEPVTYDVQVLHADPGTGIFTPLGTVQHHSALRSFDTLLAHGMVPSIDAYGVLTRDDHHRLEVTLTDLAGNQSVVLIPSLDMVEVKTDPAVETELPLIPQLITSDLSLFSHTGSDVAIDVDLDDIWEGATPAFSVADNKIPVLQLLTETSPGSGEYAVPTGVTLTPSGSSRVEASVTVQASVSPAFTYGPPTSQIPGPFLLAPGTDGAGKTRLTFSASGIATNTEVRVVMIGAFELVGSPPSTTFSGFSVRFWQLPMTETANRWVQFTF